MILQKLMSAYLVLQLLFKMLTTKQIAVFFDCEYLWKKSIDFVDVLHGDNS